MSGRVVNFNGAFVPEADAAVPLYDSALQIGDMAFEATRTFHHRPFRLRQHLQRLVGTLERLRIDPRLSVDELEQVTLETLQKNLPTEDPDVDWLIFHNISRGPTGVFASVYPPERQRPTVIVGCFPIVQRLTSVAEKYSIGLDLVVPRQPAIPPNLLPTHIKTRGRLHYKLADLEVQEEHPGKQAVLIDPSGQITEGTNNNIFLVKDGLLRTPPHEVVLSGVTRSVILELAKRLHIPTEETRLEISDALGADEVFVTSTSIGLLHARSFNGQTIGQGLLGPVSRQLRVELDREVGLSFEKQAQDYSLKMAQQTARDC